MRRKTQLVLLLLFSLFIVPYLKAQNMGNSRERRRVLSKWHVSKRKRRKMDAYNPYVDKDPNGNGGKSKHLSSKREARENKKVEKQQAKAIRKQKRKLRREGKGYKKVKKAK